MDTTKINWRPIIPHTWRGMLQDLTDRGCGPVYIAGGALRSLMLGRAVNDVDIFLYHPEPWEVIGKLGHEMGLREGPLLNTPYAWGITAVRAKLPPFDLCFTHRPMHRDELLGSFDSGVSMLTYDLLNGLSVHPQFRQDIESRQISYAPSCSVQARIDRRLGKLKRLFPGFKVVSQ